VTAKACTCRSRRSSAQVVLGPCEWHRAYRKARAKKLGDDERRREIRAGVARRNGKLRALQERVAVLESQVASLQMGAPRGIP
jgi:phage gp16-like protein